MRLGRVGHAILVAKLRRQFREANRRQLAARLYLFAHPLNFFLVVVVCERKSIARNLVDRTRKRFRLRRCAHNAVLMRSLISAADTHGPTSGGGSLVPTAACASRYRRLCGVK